MTIEVPSLLISDDDVGLRETLRGLFEAAGYRTLVASDGEEALTLIRQEQVHVLLLDMHMPKLTGLEVIQAVRQFNALIPFILLSARADEELVRRAELLRAYSVLSKPVTRRRITLAVAQALHQFYDWPMPEQAE